MVVTKTKKIKISQWKRREEVGRPELRFGTPQVYEYGMHKRLAIACVCPVGVSERCVGGLQFVIVHRLANDEQCQDGKRTDQERYH